MDRFMFGSSNSRELPFFKNFCKKFGTWLSGVSEGK